MTVGELRKWLAKFSKDDLAAIDEGGLVLEINGGKGSCENYLEIGGWPLDEDEDE